MTKFFKIKYAINRTYHECGPYCSFQNAVDALMNLLPSISSVESKNNKFTYSAEIHECVLDKNGNHKTIDIPLTENKCQRYKMKQKQHLKVA